MKLPLVGTVTQKDGKYIIVQDFEERFQIHLAKLKDKRVTTTVKAFHKTNTPKQKAYLHGVVIPIAAAAMGYFRQERDHVYRLFKLEYLKATDDKGREYILELKENSDDPIDTQLMSWFTDQIRNRIAVDCGINIPDPDKNYDRSQVEDLIMELEK